MKKLLALVTLFSAAACVQHTFKSDDDDDDDDGSIWERPDDGDGNSGAGGSGNTTSSTKSATSTKTSTSGPTSGSSTITTGSTSQVGPATTTTGPTGCDAEATCNDCQACSFGSDCATQYNACGNNPECFALNDCLNLCQDQACVDQCVVDHDAGVDDLLGLIDCIFCNACYVTCDGAASC